MNFLEMSRATIGRCLKTARFSQPHHGISTTKPGSLLKQAIPIPTFTPWDEEQPGFRVLAFARVSLEAKARLTYDYVHLNPVGLRDHIVSGVATS